MKHLKLNKPLGLSLVMALCSFAAHAQEPQMADTMRQDGMIYVVVGVVTIIFIGIVIYLISLDRKVGKLEKMLQNNKK